MAAEVRGKSTPRARGVSSKAPVPREMRSAPSLAAVEAIRDDYARALVLVQMAEPKRPRKRGQNALNDTLRLLIHQVTCAISLADAQVRSIVREDGVVRIESMAS